MFFKKTRKRGKKINKLITVDRPSFFYDRPSVDILKIRKKDMMHVTLEEVKLDYYLGAFCARGPGAGAWLGWGTWQYHSTLEDVVITVDLPSFVVSDVDSLDISDMPSVFEEAINRWEINTNVSAKRLRVPILGSPWELRLGRPCAQEN